jgi:hypothetical protein
MIGVLAPEVMVPLHWNVEQLWYVFPVEVLAGRTAIYIFPHPGRKRSRFEIYREAWHLLQEPQAPHGQIP